MSALRIHNNKFRFFFKTRTLYVLIFLALSGWSLILSISDNWTKDRIKSDVLVYYSYLPATFICHDITLKSNCEGRYWTSTAPNGGNVFKMTMGMSFMYLPFFTLAHITAPIFHEKQDGYSDPYQKMILFASLFYALLGLIFTFKSLKLFFSEQVSFVTSLLIFYATNLLCYSTIESGMSHSFLFGLSSIYIYVIIKWNEKITYSRTILIGLILGLMTLIRPTSILFIILFLLYNIKTKKDFFEKLSYLFKNYIHLLLIGLCAFMVIVPQLIYWKYITDNWIYYSYGDETFFWKNPHIIDGLFSFRKGWFVYTPIMFFACLGIFYIRKFSAAMFLPTLVFLPIFIYITLSWWCWWYGGTFGQRSFIDTYGLMSFPLAALITKISKHKILKFFWGITCLLFVVLNFFQSWQYSKGLLHWDSMTKESYLKTFAQTTNSGEYYHSLWEPDFIRAMQGKSEEFRIEDLYNSNIALKTCDFKFLSLRNGDTLLADTYEDRHLQHFKAIKTGDNQIALLAYNNKYVSVDANRQNGLFAKSDSIGKSEKFNIGFFKENYISLIAFNKKYIRINPENNILVADSDSCNIQCRLRVFSEN